MDEWKLVATHDGGRTWRPVPKQPCAANPLGLAPFQVAPVSARRGWIWRFAGRPLRSDDGGRSWRPAAGWPLPRNTYSVTFGSAFSDTDAYAAVRTHEPTLLLRTSNAGRSWTTVHRWPHP